MVLLQILWGGVLRRYYFESRLAACGENLIINGKPLIFGPDKISLGNHVTLNHGCTIAPRGKVEIEDYVTMSRGAQITAGELDTGRWTGERYKHSVHREGDVHIGEGCWLCVNSVVLPGVNISGKGVIVAAGAVVADDITEDYVIVGGIPAKIIKDMKEYD